MMVQSSSNEKTVENNLKMFYLSQLVVASAILLVTFLYKEKPPTPTYVPESLSVTEESSFLKDLIHLAKNKYFIYLSQSYAIYFSLFVIMSTLINPFLTSKFNSQTSQIGWMGFWNSMTAIVGFILVGRFVDRYQKYQLTAVLLNVSSMMLWLTFVLVLKYTSSLTSLYIIYFALGLVALPFNATGLETAGEMTFPVSEEISSSVLLVVSNFYTFLMIYGFGMLTAAGYVTTTGFAMVALYGVSSVFAGLSKIELRRFNAQNEMR